MTLSISSPLAAITDTLTPSFPPLQRTPYVTSASRIINIASCLLRPKAELEIEKTRLDHSGFALAVDKNDKPNTRYVDFKTYALKQLTPSPFLKDIAFTCSLIILYRLSTSSPIRYVTTTLAKLPGSSIPGRFLSWSYGKGKTVMHWRLMTPLRKTGEKALPALTPYFHRYIEFIRWGGATKTRLGLALVGAYGSEYLLSSKSPSPKKNLKTR